MGVTGDTEARRARSRIVWAIGAAFVFTAPLIAFSFGSGSFDVRRVSVVGVDRQFLPRGPLFWGYSSTAPLDRRHRLAKVDQFIPDPLPQPLWQGFECDVGWVTTIVLANGRTVSYGPCRIPPSITASGAKSTTWIDTSWRSSSLARLRLRRADARSTLESVAVHQVR